MSFMKTNIKVPFNYLPFEFKSNKNIFKSWKKLIKSTQFTLGPYVEDFENKFARYIGVKYCISTNNGTDALILCLKSLGIKKGDEVITVTNTFYATVGAIVAVGAKPILVDCDKRYQIDTDQIIKKINKKTRAIMPVHWAGASPNMEKIMNISKTYNIPVIEDACMGIGGKWNNKSPGTFGIVNAFSMHPLKSLNVMGDGGMIVTKNKKIANWLKKYRNHGMINRDNLEFWGVNARLQPLQAIVANEGLRKINTVISKRLKNSIYLDKKLSNLNEYLQIPLRCKKNLETNALYMVLCKDRNKLMKFLSKNGIETKIHYPIPLHLQKPAKELKLNNRNFPVSQYQAKHLLTLPVHQYLTKKQLDYMINKIKYFYKK
jgi:dTDP-3-amino-2,3,6-trideoxy-4-keto-D-glucose/dTDP-3-amino-3,4,6-trideoxy-alpha-D-glucose/dTDP-2,6-dideoxy-D-kanosamine transaminase